MVSFLYILTLSLSFGVGLGARDGRGKSRNRKQKWSKPSSSPVPNVPSPISAPDVPAPEVPAPEVPSQEAPVSDSPVVAPAPAPAPSYDAPVSPDGVWQPVVGTEWQIVLNSKLDTPKACQSQPEVFDIDLEENDKPTFDALKAAGKKCICYFSAGSFEDWRPDAGDFASGDLGQGLDGWPGEKWLNLKSAGVRSVMAKRIQRAAEKGCDAIDPDNIDGYSHDTGFGLQKGDSVDFMKFLSDEAKKYGMAVGLKNGGEIIQEVLPMVQFSVNEQCSEHNECGLFSAFINAGKPVFRIEYPGGSGSKSSICAASGSAGFSTVLKDMDLGMGGDAC